MAEEPEMAVEPGSAVAQTQSNEQLLNNGCTFEWEEKIRKSDRPLFGCSTVPSENGNQDGADDANGDNGSIASGGMGPSGPSSTGGSLVPLESNGCTTAPKNPSWSALLGLLLFGVLRKRKEGVQQRR